MDPHLKELARHIGRPPRQSPQATAPAPGMRHGNPPRNYVDSSWTSPGTTHKETTLNPDPQVNAKAVLRAIQDLRRRGTDRVIDELERIEPDLVEYVLESSSAIHHELELACSSGRHVKRIRRRVEELVLVAILSLRHAHHELWQDLVQQSPLARLDSPPEELAQATESAGNGASNPEPPSDADGSPASNARAQTNPPKPE